jgi:rubrerythrin
VACARLPTRIKINASGCLREKRSSRTAVWLGEAGRRDKLEDYASEATISCDVPPASGISIIFERRTIMVALKGSKTHQNLKDAFAGESQANRRYLYFAKNADVEGYPDIAGLFRDTADGETGHAHGHLDYLKKVGDPATGLPIGDTLANLESAIAGETHEYTDMYPGMAKSAREEGFAEIADWFETLAKAEKSHAGRFAKGKDSIG